MIYVFDTSSLIVLNNYYPDTFKLLWSGMGALVSRGEIISTREVLKEIQTFTDRVFILQWAKDHKAIFTKPTNPKLVFVQDIFAVPHFQALIDQKALLRGTPVADPFVIAAAAVREGTVVTQEVLKKHAAKIPNVGEYFKIPCINLEEFMKSQNWSF